MQRGYIKLHREIQGHWSWEDKPFARGQAWIDLILSASHKPVKFPHGNEIIDIGRGSFITSELKLMERWGWSKTKVRAFLKLLENDKMIVKKSDNKKTAITIVNYDVWQDSETIEELQKDRKKTAERPQKNTINNEKNEKNEKNEQENKPLGEVSPHKTLIDYFCDKHFEKTSMKYLFDGGKDGKVIQSLLKAYDAEFIKGFIDWYFTTNDQFIANCGYGIGKLKISISKYIAEKTKGDGDNGSKLGSKNRIDENEEFFRRG